jgi:nucleotide-binding universal stress UspA family protein
LPLVSVILGIFLYISNKNALIKSIKNIGLSFSFSPFLESMLFEVKKLSGIFSAKVTFLHCGNITDEQKQHLRDLLFKTSFRDNEYTIAWQEGNVPKTIAMMAENEKVDLLVSGVIKKDSFIEFFSGSVARNIARHAHNSVLLIPDPDLNSRPIETVVISVHDEHPEKVIETGLLFAKKMQVKKIHIVKESVVKGSRHVFMRYYSEKDYYRMHEQIIETEHKYIRKLLEPYTPLEIDFSIKVLFGHSGIALVEYARQIKADLIVDAYPEFKVGILDRLFPHDIEYALKDLPCKLLLVN